MYISPFIRSTGTKREITPNAFEELENLRKVRGVPRSAKHRPFSQIRSLVYIIEEQKLIFDLVIQFR